jgi:hypothetical protein
VPQRVKPRSSQRMKPVLSQRVKARGKKKGAQVLLDAIFL